MNVTVATEMVRSGFSDASLEDFDQQIDQVPPGSKGLLLLPYLEGERVPILPKGPEFSSVSVRLPPRRPTLVVPAMEGVDLGIEVRFGTVEGTGFGTQRDSTDRWWFQKPRLEGYCRRCARGDLRVSQQRKRGRRSVRPYRQPGATREATSPPWWRNTSSWMSPPARSPSQGSTLPTRSCTEFIRS